MAHGVSVLLVDDSLVIRAALKRLLDKDEDIVVLGSVTDGKTAVTHAAQQQPDVIILDIEMPVMDGLTALPLILEKSPASKVIMFSSLTEKGADVTLKALSLGAVECLVKPSSQQNVGAGSEFEIHLCSLIKALGKEAKAEKAGKASSAVAPAKAAAAQFQLRNDSLAYKGLPSLLAIGSSTGGPNALFEVCKHFQGFQIPIVITQHMPATFTKILAQHIQEKTGVPSVEGAEGMPLVKGRIHIAPGGFHMVFKKTDNETIIQLNDEPPVNFCKPSVDPMIKSAVSLYGNRVLGVILTGMGSDGLDGCQAIAKENGRVIAQDEQTSTVWGMPRAVAMAGICSHVMPLQNIGPWVRDQVR